MNNAANAHQTIAATPTAREFAAPFLSALERDRISFLPFPWQHSIEKSYQYKWGAKNAGPHVADRWLENVIKSISSIEHIGLAFVADAELRDNAEYYARLSEIRLGNGYDSFPLGVTKSDVIARSKDGIAKRLSSPSFWYKRLRIAGTRAAETAAFYVGLTGQKTSKYCSAFSTRKHKWRKEKSQRYLKNRRISNGQVTLSLDKVTRTPKQRSSELYVVSKGMEQMAEQKGLCWLFVTMTCPPRMHPNPSKGKNSWDGTTPVEAAKWLQNNWQRVRAMLAKSSIPIFGLWSKEPHVDACPHMHVLIYCHPRHIGEIERCLRLHCDKRDKGVRYTAQDDVSTLSVAAQSLYRFLTDCISIDKPYFGSYEELWNSFRYNCCSTAERIRLLEGDAQLSNQRDAKEAIKPLLDEINQLRWWTMRMSSAEVGIHRMPAYKGRYEPMKYYPYDFSSDDMARGAIYKTPAMEIIKGLPKKKGERRCSPASYIQKYIMKSTDDGVELNLEASSATWGYRRYGLFGIDASLVLWRELRRCDEETAPACMRASVIAAKGNDFVGFYCNLYEEVKPLSEWYENSYGERVRRVIGVVDTSTSEAVRTHGQWVVVTDEGQDLNSESKKSILVTVSHSYPRGRGLDEQMLC